ncbi:MAG: sugar ABC transporter permease, partial [Ruminococcaceae bacterium]|nr:sugar ABC transporter permease [Oscillospiraceae bacterium]
MKSAATTKDLQVGQRTFLQRLGRDMQRNYSLYLLVIPVILFYVLF